MKRLGLLPALCLCLASVAACTPCDRDGCDATRGPVADDGHGAIAGVVAGESDVVGNGCQECKFTSVALSFWKAPAPVGDSASAKAIVDGAAPTATVQADGRYEQALDPGSYLVCDRPDCASVDVAADHLTTVHIKVILGPTQFIVFDPQAKTARTAAPLDVGL